MRVYLAIAFSIFVWGNAFLAIRVALNELTPIELVAFRFLPLAFLTAGYLVVTARKRAVKILQESWFHVLAISILLIPAYNWFLCTGQQRVSPGLAALIVGSSPVFTYLVALGFRQESLSGRKTVGLLVAFAGLYVAIRYGSNAALAASGALYVLLTFMATVSTAFSTVLIRSFLERYSSWDLMSLALTIGGLPLVVALNSESLSKLSHLALSTWLSLCFLILFSTLLGFFTWFYALKRMPATNVIVFINAMPFLTMLFGYLFFGQPIKIWLLGGGCLLAGGIYLTASRP